MPEQTSYVESKMDKPGLDATYSKVDSAKIDGAINQLK